MHRALACVVTLFALTSLARPFELLPAVDGEPATGLKARVVQYDGSTNGQMVVEVTNPTSAAQRFNPDGLFFVPRMNPDQAPQRLGAVGGFDVTIDGVKKREERLLLAPNTSAIVRLDVYCIDSHRSSPTAQTPFSISPRRMPRQLVETITTSTKAVADQNGGYAAPASKSAVQGKVWESRDKAWRKLDGEGKQEANK